MCENNLRCSRRRTTTARRSELSKVNDRFVTAGREEEKISQELCEGQSSGKSSMDVLHGRQEEKRGFFPR
jgi:hypothetical protein